MKNKYILLAIFCIIFGTANSQNFPIVEDFGLLEDNFHVERTHDTNLFGNNFTGKEHHMAGRPPTNDVIYKFTINKPTDIIIDHCGSALDNTFVYLLNSYGEIAAYNDDAIDLEGSDEAYMCQSGSSLAVLYVKKLPAGTYYIVSEGREKNGEITTSISRYTYGNYFEHPINLWNQSTTKFRVSDTQDIANFYDGDQSTTNNIYYKFEINKTMEIVVSHCGSGVSSTSLSLLDKHGNPISFVKEESDCYNAGHAFLRKTLNYGTYYVVSKTNSQSGNLTTTISGYALEDFGYPEAQTIHSSDMEDVGSVEGEFNVSPMGAATFSVPIEMPKGIGSLQPSLAITYNSQSGNGVAGWGCNISGISAITRGPKNIYHDGTAKGITHSDDDAFYLDGQRLILVSGSEGKNGAIYSPESDPFTIVTLKNDISSSNPWFEIKSSNGIRYSYGGNSSNRQTYTVGGYNRVNAWYLGSTSDQLDNYMIYTYTKDNIYVYLNKIIYGRNGNYDYEEYEDLVVENTITFSYENRNDITPFVIEGVKGSMSKRLKTITSKTNNITYRTYELTYNDTGDASPTKYSRLTDITVKNGAGESLKPTKLNWTYLPEFTQSYVTPSVKDGSIFDTIDFADQDYIAADVDGDGLADLISIVGNKALIRFAEIDVSGNVSFGVGRMHSVPQTRVSQGLFGRTDWMNQVYGISAIDIDGDGINEMLIPEVAGEQVVNFHFYNNNLQNNYKYLSHALNRATSKNPAFAIGDINNNGKSNVILMEDYSGPLKSFLIIMGFDDKGKELTIKYELDLLPSDPEKMFISDFNGDGLNDILVFRDKPRQYSDDKGGYVIYWNQGNGISGSTFSDAHKTSGTNITDTKLIREGDFNGDGLIDFLMNAKDDKNWYFALNNGDGTFTKTLACQLDVYDQHDSDNDNDKFSCFVYDFDLDGKSDVVITKAMYNSSDKFSRTYTYWMKSEATSNSVILTRVMSSGSGKEGDGKATRFVLGDFNGDGQLELMNYGYNCYSIDNNSTPIWRLYKNNKYNANSGKVTSITNGYGVTTSISYASLANSGIYTKDPENRDDLNDENDADEWENWEDLKSSYPVINYTLPIHAVKSVITNDGMNLNYKYKGLKGHLQGKGLLGMRWQMVTNTTLGIETKSKVTYNKEFWQPSRTLVETKIGNSISESLTTLNFVNKGGKLHFIYPAAKYGKDLDGNSVSTKFTYNETYGYLTEEKSEYNANLNMFKTTQYSDHVLAGGVYQPQLITIIQKHLDDPEGFIQKKKITYNTYRGYPTKTIDKYESSLPLTTDYTYNEVGNLLSAKTSGSGIAELTQHTVYDATARFVAKTYTVPESTTASYTYDNWGNVLTEKDETNSSNILTTSYAYDNWGNLKSTTSPDGQKEAYYSGWNNYSNKKFYTLTQAKGQPWVKTWYDKLGREVLMETKGPLGMDIKSKKEYNTKGQLSREESIEGNITTWTSYTYDNRGRVQNTKNSLGQEVVHSYEALSETTQTNGRTYTKVFDTWGNIKTSIDPVSTVNYKYKSVGKPETITTGGATLSMTYYDTGLQKTLTDPNAGTTTYTYDAAGRIIKQVDALGKTTTNVYDALGRLSSSSLAGSTTTYEYGTSGFNKLRLTRVQEGNNYIVYWYDKYGRIWDKKQVVNSSEEFYFTYSYNSLGQLGYIDYPIGWAIYQQYDAYGYLQKIENDDLDAPIWELKNSTGTTTSTKLGGIMDVIETRNSTGLLASQKTLKGSAVLHNMNYEFNAITGNLTSRTGMIPQTEVFEYDNMDRLTAIKHNGLAVMNMGYQANGNINNKTGLGQYNYRSKPHAVSSVGNDDNILPFASQYVRYNNFNKVNEIIQSEQENSISTDNKINILTIQYGPDRERWASTLIKSDGKIRRNIYAGNFEQITENGVTYRLNYIDGADGLAAIYVTQSGQPNKIYYVHKDHLGSIVKLTDENGTEVFAASYDAWGKQTVTNNTFKFHRGYTGHEHLPEFGLINMNGRMYDPELARFLSPDPYVQMPDFSQNFNRYSYCFNNPLIYTDPSGEYAIIDDLIVAGIGGTINLIGNAIAGNVNSWGEGFSYFGVGALGSWAGMYTGPIVGGAIISGGNSVVSQTQGFQQNINNVNWEQVGQNSIMGAITGHLSGGVGQILSKPLNTVYSSVTNPLLNNVLKGSTSGFISGFTVNAGMARFNGASWDEAFASGRDGAIVGTAVGASTSAISWLRYAHKNNLNWKTGDDKPIRGYRYVTEGEINAIKGSGYLRGGIEGETYFTKDRYKSGTKAQQRLSLKTTPTYRVEFEITNNPKIQLNGTKVAPAYGMPGKGSEFMTTDKVRINLNNLNIQKLGR